MVTIVDVPLQAFQSASELGCLFDLLSCYGEVLHGEGQLEVLALKVTKYITKRLVHLKKK